MPRHASKHPLRVQPLLIERRPFVINTTEVSQDPIHFFTAANGLDPTEAFLHSMLPYAVPQLASRRLIFHTVDAAWDIKYREIPHLLMAPFTTEFWSMCELLALQSKRKNRPLLYDLPNHFLIGSWVDIISWNTDRGLFIADSIARAKYIFPAGSRIFRPRRV
jgi:hypothetical protein